MKINHKKLKIAIVSDAIYPYNTGGKEKRIHEISTRLAKAGHDVNIYCMKWWKGKNTRVEEGVKLHAISKLYPLYAGNRRSIKQAIMFSLACFKLMKENFDVIDVDHMPHLVLFSTKIICILKRKKLCATWSEVWGRKYWNEYLGKPGILAYGIEWFSARMPDKIIAVSEHTKNKLINTLKIKKEIVVIENGINLKEIKKAKPSKEKSDIIYAGRLLSHKNIDVLIQSVKILKKDYPKIKTLIIGNGPERKKIEKLVKKFNLRKNIKIVDFLEKQNDLYSLLKSSKIFVFPSTREGFGIVTLEANAAGIPVITIDHKNNAAKDLIKNNKNGITVRLNIKDISLEVSKLLIKNASKKDCLKAASNYDWKNVYRQAENLYRII